MFFPNLSYMQHVWSRDIGYIYWDDEDNSNANRRHGVLPNGIYNENTKIFFCCRNDPMHSFSHQLVFSLPKFLRKTLTSSKLYRKVLSCVKSLPNCSEIMLMRYKGTCSLPPLGYRGPHTGYLQWDTENNSNADQRIGVFPDGAKTFGSGIKIEFCSYTSNGKNCWTYVCHPPLQGFQWTRNIRNI